MLRYFLLVVFASVFTDINTAACQTVEQGVRLSETEFTSGNYETAALDFQRAWLFAEDSRKAYLEQRIADCFYNLDEYERAAGFYGSALLKTVDDSTRNALLLNIAACHIHAGEFYNAINDLSLLQVADGGYQAERRWFFRGICNWGINRYDEAFNCFGRAVPEENLAAKEKILQLKADFGAIRYPNPRLAAWLSIIPGFGQFYCLEPGPGFNSLLLNGSLMLAGYFSLVIFKNNVFLLNLLPWIQRYYAGGIEQAKGYAERKLLEKHNKIYENIIGIVAESQPTD